MPRAARGVPRGCPGGDRRPCRPSRRGSRRRAWRRRSAGAAPRGPRRPRGARRPRWTRSAISRTGLIVPTAFDARPTATSRVRGPRASSRSSSRSVQSSGSMPTQRTTRSRSRAIASHGATLASWSMRVRTISSPGARLAPIARLSANVIVVMFGPKAISSGSVAPSRSATAARVPAMSCVGLGARREGAMGVRAAVREVVADRVQACVGDLRARGTVEPGDGHVAVSSREGREARPDRLDVIGRDVHAHRSGRISVRPLRRMPWRGVSDGVPCFQRRRDR